ncbi:MAG TPA: DUF3109 domain-containing protein [Marinilabiliales bacterium]|jgi:hypothetical protein|nr:MAG: hypothetical protein A2W95_11490 [Bacteroidetes bacterium GWA2_40_14]OFX61718.1 MAG: hypothetical protein A2W84_13525 [Bacteroidetes bacterium GWC2_40_13]OFX72491.1 MAG: hypothetical protein A2W96_05485 [Bacteroidetes bacterium GWD2_40_43]OFX90575.1 MAG: hypothetical protein A2W97_02255 [Bacteroidetes bacterium GWE2_40_63]OFY20947.1 MAG: hypothetical protein A2W88_18005 [Bacteroidetes bacterium GWF2_40_13]OFZ26466.1 MAG: hypothetical protein A2437_07150 [Bacteroidetes bacterium RIFOXYC
MLQIENTLISLDILEKKFVCNLHACKGACCVEGDSGAPLDAEETPILEQIFPQVKPYMTPEGIETVQKLGTWVVDDDGDKVTPLVNNRECAYVYRNQEGIVLCAIEKAFNEGKVSFQKPVSCHLYPIRVKKYADFDAVNYESNHLCVPARVNGEKLGVPVYQFVRGPLIRKFGEEWFHQLEIAANELLKAK